MSDLLWSPASNLLWSNLYIKEELLVSRVVDVGHRVRPRSRNTPRKRNEDLPGSTLQQWVLGPRGTSSRSVRYHSYVKQPRGPKTRNPSNFTVHIRVDPSRRTLSPTVLRLDPSSCDRHPCRCGVCTARNEGHPGPRPGTPT